MRSTYSLRSVSACARAQPNLTPAPTRSITKSTGLGGAFHCAVEVHGREVCFAAVRACFRLGALHHPLETKPLTLAHLLLSGLLASTMRTVLAYLDTSREKIQLTGTERLCRSESQHLAQQRWTICYETCHLNGWETHVRRVHLQALSHACVHPLFLVRHVCAHASISTACAQRAERAYMHADDMLRRNCCHFCSVVRHEFLSLLIQCAESTL